MIAVPARGKTTAAPAPKPGTTVSATAPAEPTPIKTTTHKKPTGPIAASPSEKTSLPAAAVAPHKTAISVAVPTSQPSKAQPSKTLPSKEQPSRQDSFLKKLKQQTSRLEAELRLRQKKLEAQLLSLKEENIRLQTQYNLAKQKHANALLQLNLQKQTLATQAAVRQAMTEKTQEKRKAQLADLNLELQLSSAQHKKELSQLKLQIETLKAKRQLTKALAMQELATLQDKQALLAARNALKAETLRTTQLDLTLKESQNKAKITQAQTSITLRTLRHQHDAELDGKPLYRKQPFVNGTLYISDRRIKLSGPIISGTADYICDRIHFFNNASKEFPIFLVIDNCPGGSVMQGYRIVKAIQSSDAPVYVVVKSFAASMAAIITTLADHSYAYPNAVILHHQMSAGAMGNMTDIQDQIRILKEWERRLAEPVAKKMGLTIEQFKKQMYAHRASGDWDEFADKAVKLHWVGHVVQEVREEGTRKKPQGDPPQPWWWRLFSQDSQGRTYCKLPPLEPMDAYFIYNLNGFYRP